MNSLNNYIMRNLIKLCAIALVIFTACKSEKSEKTIEQPVVKTATNFDAFGEVISADEAMTSSEMFAKYNAMQVGDTVSVKFASKINDVCSKKGCWMKLPVGEKEAMVRFKDYSFFMPLDSKGKEVIVDGVAFLKETSQPVFYCLNHKMYLNHVFKHHNNQI